MFCMQMMFIGTNCYAMQTLINVCYEYGIDNAIIFNLIESVCTVFKPKAYKLYLPKVFISSDPFKFSKESKYLGLLLVTLNNIWWLWYVTTIETIVRQVYEIIANI